MREPVSLLSPPCECFDADLGFLWVEAEQKLHLKVGSLNFGPVQDLTINPINIWAWICKNLGR